METFELLRNGYERGQVGICVKRGKASNNQRVAFELDAKDPEHRKDSHKIILYHTWVEMDLGKPI